MAAFEMVESEFQLVFCVLLQESQEAKQIPAVARMARDYLGVAATSVDAEQLFSSGTDLISRKWHSLKSDTIKACMCLSNWWEV